MVGEPVAVAIAVVVGALEERVVADDDDDVRRVGAPRVRGGREVQRVDGVLLADGVLLRGPEGPSPGLRSKVVYTLARLAKALASVAASVCTAAPAPLTSRAALSAKPTRPKCGSPVPSAAAALTTSAISACSSCSTKSIELDTSSTSTTSTSSTHGSAPPLPLPPKPSSPPPPLDPVLAPPAPAPPLPIPCRSGALAAVQPIHATQPMAAASRQPLATGTR